MPPTEAAQPEPLVPLVPLGRLLAARRVERRSPQQVEMHCEVTEDWLQGRTSFGGLISALGAQAMRDVAEPPWPAEVSLRALQTSFVGPVGGGPVAVEAVLLRQGKNLRQVQATVRQHGQVAAVMLGVYGSDRPSALPRLQPTSPPASTRPARSRSAPSGAGPRFLQHFDLSWDHGPTPGSGGSGTDTRIHLRVRDASGLDDELVAVLLADVSPTPATGWLPQRVPASSVSWALELRPLRAPADPEGWWRADNRAVVVDGGYVNHAAELWAPSGELAALAYQVVALYG